MKKGEYVRVTYNGKYNGQVGLITSVLTDASFPITVMFHTDAFAQSGLGFDQDELEVVTQKDNPELFI